MQLYGEKKKVRTSQKVISIPGSWYTSKENKNKKQHNALQAREGK